MGPAHEKGARSGGQAPLRICACAGRGNPALYRRPWVTSGGYGYRHGQHIDMLAWTRGAKSPQFSSVPPSLASPRVAGAIAPRSHPVFRFPGKPLPLPVHCLDRFHDHGMPLPATRCSMARKPGRSVRISAAHAAAEGQPSCYYSAEEAPPYVKAGMRLRYRPMYHYQWRSRCR
jgi:hypothetical protein